MESETPKPYQRSRMDYSWATPSAIHVWTTLRFSSGPQSASELAGRLGWHARVTERLLARLAHAGFVKYDRKTGQWRWTADPTESLRIYSGAK